MLKKFSAAALSLIFVLGLTGLALAGNTSTVDQTGNDNTATVTQDGDGNVASIEQASNDSDATQDQDGNNNNAVLEQVSGWPVPGTAVINETGSQTQDGTDNQAELMQWSNEGFGGNTGIQLQEGIANNAIAWQYSIDSDVSQTQDGTGNKARIYQVGFENSATQKQEGDDNWAAIDEQASSESEGGNTAYQGQFGSRNKSLIAQYGAEGLKTAIGNLASVTQDGDDNWAGEGYNNGGLFGIFQAGDYNEAEITQDGDENEASIYQYGNLNDASIDQDGNSNVATVTQTP